MNEEEILGTLRHIQERIALLVDILTRMEQRQLEVKKEMEAEPELFNPKQQNPRN